MGKLRVGMIGGTRGFGGRRLKVWLDEERAEVAAVCSRTREAVEKLAGETGAAAYTDWRELIADPNVEAVSIATPNALHFDMARAALEAGKHTLVEYPLCQTMGQYEELLGLADEKGVTLHHGLTVRGEPIHLQLKALAPRLGRMLHGHYRYFGGGGWYLDPALRGDAFLALQIHFIDHFEDLMGETVRINGTLRVIEDGDVRIHTGTVLQEFGDGSNAFQEFGMGFKAKPSYTGWFIGENGWMQFERNSVRLVLTDGTDETFEPEPADAVARDTASFVAQVLDGAESWVPESQTRRTLGLALAASRSAQTGEKIDVTQGGVP